MKTSSRMLWPCAVLSGLLLSGPVLAADAAPQAPPPADEPAATAPNQPAADPNAAPVADAEMAAEPAAPAEPPPPAESQPVDPPSAPTVPTTPGSDPAKPTADATPAKPVETAAPAAPAAPATPVRPGEKGLRLNFRGAPLEQVLNYMSEAAGFIIVLDTKVEGKVDVWSSQLLDQDEAVSLLNSVLNKNGYAALRNGRTLTIISRDDAKKRDTPVITGANPSEIPRTDAIVTQIIPLRFINAVQVSKDLQTLIPSSANVAANEGGNALLITDTQANIHRLAEIIKALDNSISSSYAIKVFPLQYADAKSLASVIKDIFASQDSSSGRGGAASVAQQMINRFRGGPGGMFGGGGPGGGGGDAGSGSTGGRPGASRVVAVSDDRSNSVVVSAPDDVMPSVEGLVKAVDVSVEDVTEVRVFHLKFADPLEMADLLASLFPDTTSSQSGGRGQFRFGGGPFGGGGGNASASSSSERLLKQTRVTAVADQRTRSVVVSASRNMMEQITPMVAQLDADPARKRKVFVFDVENTDPQAVQDIIQTLFPEQNSGRSSNNRSTSQQNSNQLNNRQSQTRNQSRTGTSGIGGSGAGGTGFGTSVR